MFLFVTLQTEPVSQKASWLFAPEGKLLNKNLLNSRTQTSQFCFVNWLFHFQNYWNFGLECKYGKHEASFRARKVTGTFEKRVPGPS